MGKRRPVPTPAGHQQCHQCLVIKPHATFEPCNYRPVGIKATCRPCLMADRRAAALVREMQAEAYRRQCAAGTGRPPSAALEALLASEVSLGDDG